MTEKVRQPVRRTKPGSTPKGARGQQATKKEKHKSRKIQNKEVYENVMKEIDKLMKKGEKNLTRFELLRLRTLAQAAETYEDTYEPLPLPSSLPEMIRMKMFQLRLTQHFTAKLIGVSEAKFSLIMNGKQKPDIMFLKAIHEKLDLDANLLLQAL
jgi:HTH-type transcriptional regulator / antitoxin HigA